MPTMGQPRRSEDHKCAALLCLLSMLIPSIVLLCMSFHRLHTTEVGLDYNTFWERVGSTVYTKPGLHFLGLPHRFIRFPRTIQTMQYNEMDDDILHTRTSDGLPVTLGLSFQFRFDTSRAYELYMTFGGEHLQVMDNEARAVLANVACNYSAYKFFSEKQRIALDMQNVLNRDFSDKLFASVDALQIETIELPSLFQEAILESIKMKQNIRAQLKYEENMEVTFQQDTMVAQQSKNQTITLAHGDAARIHEQALANARIINATVDAEIRAYSKVQQSMGMAASADDMLSYIWWDSRTQEAEDTRSAFMVGVDQAVYVAGSGAPQDTTQSSKPIPATTMDQGDKTQDQTPKPYTAKRKTKTQDESESRN